MNFVCVDNSFVPPKDSKHKFFVLTKPDFTKFVQGEFDRSRNKRTELYMMRRIIEAIAMEAYKEELYRPNPAYVDYEGLSFNTVKDLEAIIVRILDKYCPNAIFHFMTEQIKKIPSSVEVVYFYGSFSEADPLLKRGFRLLSGDAARKYMYTAEEPREIEIEPELPKEMPIERLPEPKYVDEGKQKEKRKQSGKFKDGTTYNNDMLVGADTKSN